VEGRDPGGSPCALGADGSDVDGQSDFGGRTDGKKHHKRDKDGKKKKHKKHKGHKKSGKKAKKHKKERERGSQAEAQAAERSEIAEQSSSTDPTQVEVFKSAKVTDLEPASSLVGHSPAQVPRNDAWVLS